MEPGHRQGGTACEACAIEVHLANVRDLIATVLRAPTREANVLWVEARRAEILCCYPRTYWRGRVIHFYYLNTRLRRHKALLRRFARSYGAIRDLSLRATFIPAMNITSRVEAFEVATLLEQAEHLGASEETLHLLRSRTQYKPLF